MTKVIYFRESLVQSVLADLFTYGALLMIIIITWRLGHWFWPSALLCVWLYMVAGRAMSTAERFNDIKELKNFVNNLEEQDNE